MMGSGFIAWNNELRKQLHDEGRQTTDETDCHSAVLHGRTRFAGELGPGFAAKLLTSKKLESLVRCLADGSIAAGFPTHRFGILRIFKQ